MPDLTHPFTADSPWNTPIDPAHITYTDPSTPENRDFRDQTKANTWANQVDGVVAITPATAPVKVFHLVNVSVDVGSPGDRPIVVPDNVLTAATSEWSIWTDLDGVHVWEAWSLDAGMSGSFAGSIPPVPPGTQPPIQITVSMPDGSFAPGYLTHPDFINGTGWGDPVSGSGVGVRAAGCSLLGGLMTAADLAAGEAPHAMAIALDQSQAKSGFVAPAVTEDNPNNYRGTIPLGSRFALPPDINLANVINPLTNLPLTPEGLVIAKAYQKYGGYVVDTADHTCSLATFTGIPQPPPYNIYGDCFWIRDNLVMILPR